MKQWQLKKRYTFSAERDMLPLFIESIGYNPKEQSFSRPEGYPYYHWLQTLEGEGEFAFNGISYQLTPGKGILLQPYTAHNYAPVSPRWVTMYVTFGGASVTSILNALNINYSALYTENEEWPFSTIISRMLRIVEKESVFSKLELSSRLYHLLVMIKKYGKAHDQHSLSYYYNKIYPLVNWLESVYAEDIGLQDMAEHANISSQYLNRLFQDTFGVSPYSFLIQLRIRKAKEILVSNPELPLKKVACFVGFSDVSNFVATFRKREGMTPKKYRRLHC